MINFNPAGLESHVSPLSPRQSMRSKRDVQAFCCQNAPQLNQAGYNRLAKAFLLCNEAKLSILPGYSGCFWAFQAISYCNCKQFVN